MPSSHQCPYCPKAPRTAQGLSSHLAQSQRCKARLAAFYRVDDLSNVNNEPCDDDVEMADQPMYDPNSDLESNPDVGLDPPIMVPVARPDSLSDSDEGLSDIDVRSRCASSAEDEEDEKNARYVNDFEGAGLPHAERSLTNFEHHFEHQRKAGDKPWAPFESEDEWELARWLMLSGASQKQINEFLKLNKVFSHPFHARPYFDIPSD